ncbi:MAG TPA: NlpC/P60 family protein [Kineosporiaceae bacterium]|nr:NlpC/P60 family protein [Kineosporiaceae bacterium]
MRVVRVVAAVSVAGLAVTAGTAYLVLATVMGQSNDSSVFRGNSSSCTATVNAPTSAQLAQDQLDNAYTIVQVGVARGIPTRGLIVAIATAMQESTLRNLHYGDRDSVGLFQQRPSAGWGSVAQLTDPPTSAGKFYDALVQVSGWQSMAVTEAAQAVQRSAFPLAYAKWEGLATTLVTQMVSGKPAAGAQTVQVSQVSQVSCGQTVGQPISSGTVGGMLRTALAQLGKPYVWGATGPDSFDCSGLVVYSWRRNGHSLTVRTSEQMYGVSDPVPAGSEQPGDLLFGDFAAAGPGHVMIVVKPGTAVEAPHTGDVVKIVSYDASAWKIGRLNASAFQSGSVPG